MSCVSGGLLLADSAVIRDSSVCPLEKPEMKASDFVLVHVGFALSLSDQVEAVRVFDFLERMNQLDELEVPPP
jgi:hydrogenase expression/formation protein HypC